MRELVFEGETGFLTEKVWRSLLRRFDVSKAKAEGHDFVIEKSCVLCDDYFVGDCRGCPLRIFKAARVGCITLIDSLFEEAKERSFGLGLCFVYWPVKDDEKIRRQVKMVYDALKALPRINKKRRLKRDV